MSQQSVSIDTVRTLGEASIENTYTAIGSPTTQPVRLICFTNNTDGDMFFSIDGVHDQLFVASGSFKLFDLASNRFNTDQTWVFPMNTQFYVRYNTQPTKNAVYIECLWGQYNA